LSGHGRKARTPTPHGPCRHGGRGDSTCGPRRPSGGTGRERQRPDQRLGATGPEGPQGSPGPQGPVDPTLDGRIAQLEAVLGGITNADLASGLANAAKLDGISATQLADTITDAAKLNGISAADLTDGLANAGKLDGITALQLASTVTDAAKVSGISTAELTDAIDAVESVDALCAQVPTVVSTVNALGDAVDGIALGGTVPLLLTLISPPAPADLPAFSC
jgi:hypothetical protein